MRKFLLIFILTFFVYGVAIAGMVDNNNGTVTDTSTGLMWQKATAGTYTWQAALKYAEDFDLEDYNDWRLPNINELLTLVDDSSYDPAIYEPFKDTTGNSSYWSSTTYPEDNMDASPEYAWVVEFSEGRVRLLVAEKTNLLNVRLVRTIE